VFASRLRYSTGARYGYPRIAWVTASSHHFRCQDRRERTHPRVGFPFGQQRQGNRKLLHGRHRSGVNHGAPALKALQRTLCVIANDAEPSQGPWGASRVLTTQSTRKRGRRETVERRRKSQSGELTPRCSVRGAYRHAQTYSLCPVRLYCSRVCCWARARFLAWWRPMRQPTAAPITP